MHTFDPFPLQLFQVFLSMADWLPKNSHRRLLIDHFKDGFPSQKHHFLNVLGKELTPDHLVDNSLELQMLPCLRWRMRAYFDTCCNVFERPILSFRPNWRLPDVLDKEVHEDTDLG